MTRCPASVRSCRWSAAVATAVLLAGGASCGKSSSQAETVTTSPPGGTSSGGQPSGSSGGTSGGGTGAGGAAPTSTTPQPAPDSSGSPGGPSGSAGSGGSSAPSGDTGTSAGPGAPAGGSGGTPSDTPPPDPCAGLVPETVGNPVEVVLGSQGSCGPSTSDPSGHVTLGLWNGFAWQMTPYSPSGSPQGTPMQPLAPSGDDVDRWFHWTANGFRGILRGASYSSPNRIQSWDVSGNPTQTLGRVVTITPDGHGGTVAVVPDPSSVPNAPTPPLLLQWIDAAGALTRSVSLDNDVGAVVVNWSTDHVFALVYGMSSRATQGRWYDGNGNPLTSWFSLDVMKGTGLLWHFLMDGTLVLTGPSGDWTVATHDGVEGPVAVPDWLEARPNTRLSTIRGGRGYAVLFNGVTDRIEILSTSGKSCGMMSLPSVGSPAGTLPPRLDVGQDGTVLHGAGPAGAPGVVNRACTFRWWPGLLR